MTEPIPPTLSYAIRPKELLPLANLSIKVGYDTVQIGILQPKELAEAIAQIRTAMEL